MEKNIGLAFIALAVLTLVLAGISGATGYSMGSNNAKVEIVEVEKLVEVSIPEPFEVEVPSASLFKDLAVEEFMEYIDDEELFECNGYEYDFEEISIARIYDDFSLDFNDDEYAVAFSIKLEYDEENERSCKKSFDVEAFYEEDEDVEFTLN